jgi:transposase InsO family protein
VNIHKHARLTPVGRALLVRRVVKEGQSPASVALAAGVSRRTVYKWLERYRVEGEEGLVDRSSRPHRSPRRLPRARRRRIEDLRRKRWSSLRIARELRIPLSTVVVTQRRLGLGRLRSLAPQQPVIRYERKRPGEMLHIDTKKLGRIGRVGHRIHGDRRRCAPGIGWEYLYVCVDDASRHSYCEVLPDEKGVTAEGFLRRAIAHYQALGIRVERVMTDNGCGFISQAFGAALRDAGARHIRTRPYTPRTNGKAERFIQTCLREWAYAQPYAHSEHRIAALTPWLRFYNRERPHMGIHGRTPQQRLLELLPVNNVFINHT